MSHEESQQTKPLEQMQKETESYLVFKLGGELFGANLLKILEVMKPTSIKPVPYMIPAFKGVVNLRGQIVSVVDLRVYFQLPIAQGNEGMILIVETNEAPVGVIVDDLISVDAIAESEIDSKPVVETRVPSQFLLGIAKNSNRLMTLMDISGCLASMEMRAVRQKGRAA